MTAITQVISPLTAVPDPDVPATFPSLAPPFTVSIAAMAVQLETFRVQANTLAAALNAAISGGAFAIDYTFSTTTTASDPGPGTLRLNNATQNAATAIYLDVLSADGADWTSAIDLFDDSTSTIKGFLVLRKADDGTKFLVFALTALATPAGYRNATVSVAASSSANPFANGDAITLGFARTGDKGDTGATGAAGTFSGVAGATVELLTGANIASAATLNLDTATGNLVHVTGTTSITAVTLTRGPRVVVFDGVLTLTHHATNNNLPSAANIATAAGDRAVYWSDGTTVYCIGYFRADGTSVIAGAGDHRVTVHTGNGYGSTNTKIRRYTTAMINVGTAITYADSATLGASFTINSAGIYAITAKEESNATGLAGISLNSSQLTTSISGVSIANRLGYASAPSSTSPAVVTVLVRLAVNDVIRPHNDGVATDVTDKTFFSIIKVAS